MNQFTFNALFSFAVFCFLPLCGKLRCQEPDYVRATGTIRMNVFSPVKGVLTCSNPHGTSHAVLNFHKITQGGLGAVPDASLVLPFHRAGGGFKVQPGVFLVAGYEFLDWTSYTGRGWLCLVKVDINTQTNTVTISLLSSSSLPGIDPVSITYLRSSEDIVIVNHYDRRLMSAAWDGGVNTLPQSFQAIADESQVPSLRFATLLAVLPNSDGDGVMVSDFNVNNIWLVKHTQNGQWSITTDQRTNSFYNILVFNACWISQSKSPDFILSPSVFNGVWDLLREKDGLCVDSGTVSTGQIIGMPLEDEYRINPGSSFSYRFTDKDGNMSTLGLISAVRYGEPQSGNALNVGRIFSVGQHSVGSQNFGCGAYVKLIQGNVNVSNAYLAIAQRNPDGTDPVDVLGDAAILQAQTVMNFSLPISRFNSTIGIRSPILNDPGLDGVVYLYQFVIELDNGESVFSDVLGLRVHPSDHEGEPLTSGYSFKKGGKIQYKKGYLAIGASAEGKPKSNVSALWKKIQLRMRRMLGK